MEKFVLYVGLNDKITKTQKINTLDAYNIINNILLTYTEGATIIQGNGIYKHENGNFTTENTFIIELLFTDEEVIKAIANDLKRILNQESIAIQKQVIESYLY